jgi:hypothetical protein
MPITSLTQCDRQLSRRRDMLHHAARLKAPAASRKAVAPSDDEMPLAGSALDLLEQVKRHGNCQFGARRGTFPSSARQEPSGANVGLLSPCVAREDRLGEPSMLVPSLHHVALGFDRGAGGKPVR